MAKRAIVYYSLSENTHEKALIIAEKLNCPAVRINTVKEMPEKFTSQIMFGGMQATFGMKPAISSLPENILEYDEIILGTPIWAGKHAPAIHTLIQDKNIREKVIAVFTLDGGGENKNCISGLKKLLPNLKYTVRLKDRKLNLESNNAEIIEQFVELINNSAT